jgi:hypothetical protein
MTDIWEIIVSVSTALTALFLFFGLYNSWRERKDKVWVTRFVELLPNNTPQYRIRVRAKKAEGVEDCTVSFDGENLVNAKNNSCEPIIIYGGGAENFIFWAMKQPSNKDEREIAVKECGKTIYKRKFKDVRTEQ